MKYINGFREFHHCPMKKYRREKNILSVLLVVAIATILYLIN